MTTGKLVALGAYRDAKAAQTFAAPSALGGAINELLTPAPPHSAAQIAKQTAVTLQKEIAARIATDLRTLAEGLAAHPEAAPAGGDWIAAFRKQAAQMENFADLLGAHPGRVPEHCGKCPLKPQLATAYVDEHYNCPHAGPVEKVFGCAVPHVWEGA